MEVIPLGITMFGPVYSSWGSSPSHHLPLPLSFVVKPSYGTPAIGPSGSYAYAGWNQCHECAEWLVTPKRRLRRRAMRAHVPTMSFFGPTRTEFHAWWVES